MSAQLICPCEGFVFPTPIGNPAGLIAISYRVGDFTSFRHALLLPRKGELELVNWRPSSPQDLSVQMVEWWAYLADILTFYNERIANESYLRTATLPESVNHLIRVLGYRPRPAIGAVGVVAALLTKQLPLALPRGFQIQSKPGRSEEPQVFELDANTKITPPPPDAIPVDIAPSPLLAPGGSTSIASVLVAGAVSTVKPGDELLLLKRDWAGEADGWALGAVNTVAQQKDAHGAVNTQIDFKSLQPAPPGGAKIADYRLLRSNQFARPWQYAHPAVAVQSGSIDLDSIVRAIKIGDPVVLEIPGGSSPGSQLISVSAYTEIVWYANAPNRTNPGNWPPDTKGVPIPIPHSRISFLQDNPFSLFTFVRQPNPIVIESQIAEINSLQDSNWPIDQLMIRYGWRDVGQLIPPPATQLDPAIPALTPTPPATLPNVSNASVQIEDANGFGESANASIVNGQIQLSGLPNPTADLSPPLRLLFGLLNVSRGKTVTDEILGSGDATLAGQEFVLKNAPLTYLQGASSISGQNYKSTLTVRVNGVAWQEVQSFYGQGPNAKVFVTREDDDHKTHVMFGDGVNGARLPSGVNNIVVTYRYGAGAKAPSAGTLNVILQPQPNLKAIRNPVAVGGGADADPPDQIRRYAPQSALTFGRAISADDYETVAAQAPGVTRARSYFTFDPKQQRAMVTIYVGDAAAAVASAKTAIALAADPNRPVSIRLATALTLDMSFTLRVDPRYETDAVVADVKSTLLDPQSGLLGASRRIGQALYTSEIYRACLAVPGAVAIHGLSIQVDPSVAQPWLRFETEHYSPGEGGFFQLATKAPQITTEVVSDV